MSTSLLFQSFGIRHVKVNRTEYINGKTVFHAKVRERLIRCPCCRSRRVIKFGHKTRKIRLVPIGKRPTILRLKTHRIKCKHCGKIRWIKLPFLEGKSNCSRGFIRYLLDLCQLMTIKSAAGMLGVGWDLVKDHHKEYLSKKYRRRGWKKIEYIGIDEFSFKAERFLEAWCNDAMNSGIPLLMKLGATIASHRTGILNYFDHRITTAKVEGINNKIKTLKRQVYGFRDLVYFKLRLFHLHKQNYSLTG